MPHTLKLVKPQADAETVKALTALLRDAQEGRVVGLAYVALHKSPNYSGDVVGHARSHPLFTMGIVSALAGIVSDKK